MADLEAKRLLLANRPAPLCGRGEPDFTASQLAVLRSLLRSRRSREAARRAASRGEDPAGEAGRGARPEWQPGRRRYGN